MLQDRLPPAPAEDTIVALATPAGRGSVGIVRLSGVDARRIGAAILGLEDGGGGAGGGAGSAGGGGASGADALQPQRAHYGAFYAHTERGAEIIDRGIALFFPAPHSLTGEDVLELQGHGSPVVMHRLLREANRLGARSAEAGEFSKRAFLNGKIDLAQAEAIADLIDSSSEQAARGAIRTLEGEFSRRIQRLEERLTELRSYLEAAMEFPEEALETLDRGAVKPRLEELLRQLDALLSDTRGGAILREGWQVAIAGPPNAGKSSLLNRLSGRDSAIITAEAGTTRDLIHEHCLLDGIPMRLTDTAGLRSTQSTASEAERIGMARAVHTMEQADHSLLVLDSTVHPPPRNAAELPASLEPWLGVGEQPNNSGHPSAPRASSTPRNKARTVVYNKIDLSGLTPGCREISSPLATAVAYISATTGSGIPALRHHLVQCANRDGAGSDAPFIARQRHLEALQRVHHRLQEALSRLHTDSPDELLAEEARLAHVELGNITGTSANEELLTKIFSTFCIGK